MKVFFLMLTTAAALLAADPGTIYSFFARDDFSLTADPASRYWRYIAPAVAENDHWGKPVPGLRTEIRSRWTKENLYLLFSCPYQTLYLKPDPKTDSETNKLWEWDVVEAFIGADFDKIWRYREYQVSPQGEWVDLDIDRKTPLPEGGWKWNSGMTVKARIDAKHKMWYGEFKIPIASFDSRPAEIGNEVRINLFRIEGGKPDRKYVVWQKTGVLNNHVPEAFGKLKLVTK